MLNCLFPLNREARAFSIRTVPNGDTAYLLIPQTKADCSRFILDHCFGNACIGTIPSNNTPWFCNLQDFSLQINMFHSRPQIFDGATMDCTAFPRKISKNLVGFQEFSKRIISLQQKFFRDPKLRKNSGVVGHQKDFFCFYLTAALD